MIFIGKIVKCVKFVFYGICRFLSSSTGAFIIALLSVMGAALVSIYSTKIVDQISYVFSDGAETSIFELVLSTCVSALAILCVAFRELGLAEKLKVKEAQLDRQRAEMEERLTSMPPKTFLALYATSIRNSGQLRSQSKAQYAQGTVSFDEVSRRVRILMNTVLSLARSWDGISKDNQTIIYKSNIMLSIPALALRKMSLEKHRAGMTDTIMQSRFFLHDQNQEAILDRCDGILILVDNQYSTSSLIPEDGPDPDIKPICFPYTRRRADGGINLKNHPNLPGAPEAMSTEEAQYIDHTTRTMKAWIDSIVDSNGLVNREYRDRVYDYYRERHEAQSILAIPIRLDGKVFAVLNIYRNNPEILMNKSRSEQFVTLLEPVCYQLAKMLLLASKLRTSSDK